FLFIGLLEDSGYLARAALIADRTMAKVGLQGKSFIPLLSAYACAVPAVLATRTIESRRDRIATILIAPFMTCSARLPVYTLVIAAFLGPAAALWLLSHVPFRNGQPPAIAESVAGTFGRAVEPLIAPLGLNWKVGIGLVTSLAAREVIVGTLGTIYGMEGTAESVS